MVNKDQLKESNIQYLIRFAKFLGLSRDLESLDKKHLVKLILWKLRRDAPFDVRSGWG